MGTVLTRVPGDFRPRLVVFPRSCFYFSWTFVFFFCCRFVLHGRRDPRRCARAIVFVARSRVCYAHTCVCLLFVCRPRVSYGGEQIR